MTVLWLDFETFSETPIKDGVHRYAEKAEIMLFAWAIDDEPAEVWDCTSNAPCPPRLSDALVNPDVIIRAHNTGFDRTVMNHDLLQPTISVDRWEDTMVQAMAHGLPGALGKLCEILGVESDKAKDKEGKALIQLFCKPRKFSHKLTREHFSSKARLDEAIEKARLAWNGRATSKTHPAEWAKFVDYARLDIEAMRAVYKKLPKWNYQGAELALWRLDQRINDRGVAIDLELAAAAVRAVEKEQERLADWTITNTAGQVDSATQVAAMISHIQDAYGIKMSNMQMATLEMYINHPDTPEGLRELLKVRLQASTSSTSKYKTLLRGTSSDGRLRGVLQFCGASRTGRWAGRLFQPQNLPRPTLDQEQIDCGIEALKADCADLIFDDVMRLSASAIRGVIVAPRGKKLVIADLSNIEGRDQAWLANETWKLQAFRDFDNGKGPDLYKMAYGKSFGIDPSEVTKDQRQVGKVQELALGYEGGVGAFVTFAAVYGIDLDDLADRAAASMDSELWERANGMLEWHRKNNRNPTASMSESAWLTCEAFKLAWREAHPAIASYWKELDKAVRTAIEKPGEAVQCRRLKVYRKGAWLRILLPSGRSVTYPVPSITNSKITYKGVDQYTRRWQEIQTYGGKIFENVCQAVARDVMAHNMPLIEAAGYEIVLTVHDEVICEAPDSDEFNEDHLAKLLAANPPWALDMPLAAAGFQTKRYKKD